MKSLFSLLAVVCLVTAVWAEEGDQWVTLVPGVAPGTPAQVVLDEELSSPTRTVFDVTIFGFWVDRLTGPDGVDYERICVPGLPSAGQPGAPDLPVVRTRVAVPTDGDEIRLASVNVVNEVTLSNYELYPLPVAGEDEEIDPTEDPGEGDENGFDDIFFRDDTIYSMTTPWPPVDAVALSPVTKYYGSIPGAECECFPVHWNPQTKELKVGVALQYDYSHAGSPQKFASIPKNTYQLADCTFLNWSGMIEALPPNLTNFEARYLVVTAPEFDDELEPLINLKKSQGFQVIVRHLAGGENWLQILGYIKSWYEQGPEQMEHYCLLVGDTNRIPLGHLIQPADSDDYYGSPLDLDLQEEVWVGRLSFDSANDLSRQVTKIVAYQTSPHPGGRYDRVILVAHKQGSPGKYEGAHEAVRTESYFATNPTFVKQYGAQGATDATVQFWLNVGAGLVAYRGHGSTNTWSHWNDADESFSKNDVINLTNDEVIPVVWAFTCTNGNVGANGGGGTDCISEAWLEMDGYGGVASYGATRTTSTKPNHELDLRLFEAVYDFGIKTHAHAISYAENRMMFAYPDTVNAWAYLLLGDPSMKIRTDVPPTFNISVQLASALTAHSLSDLEFQVLSEAGAPLAGALVSLWKAGADGVDDVFTNGYADDKGVVRFSVAPSTAGPLTYMVQDDDGNLSQGTLQVGCGNTADNTTYGVGKPGSFGVPSLTALDQPVPGEVSSIRIAKGLPGAIPLLVLGVTSASIPFDGGTLLANPNLILTIPAPIQTDGKLVISGLIPDSPNLCGLPIYHQVMIPDPGAAGYYHVALTNGLRRTFGAP